MIYANVRIAATLPLKCNILIVKTFDTVGPDLLKKASFQHKVKFALPTGAANILKK